jgi:PAS domain S-box-containing protein
MTAKTILLVEDEADHAELVRRAFEGLTDRFSIERVTGLEAAREYLSRGAPDLALVDLHLPDGPGLDFLTILGDEPSFPVVVLSPDDDGDAAVTALNAGAVDYAVKSAAILDLPRIAERALWQWDQVIERRSVQESLRKVNRTLRLLSECNQTLIRATEETSLLKEICRLIVEEGGYRLAWVGLAEADESKSVRPAAQAGFEDGYLDTLRLTWADTERGRGPAGTAIRTGVRVICRDIHTDPHFAVWRDEALQRGYASVISIPLTDQGRVIGALIIYSASPDAFDDDEVSLLEELAADLSYGVWTLRTREESRRAEEALRHSERMLADAQRLAHVGSWVWEVATGKMEWSEEVYRIFGLDPDEFEPNIDSVMSRLRPEDRRLGQEVITRSAPGSFQYTFEVRILRPDGSERRLISTSEGTHDEQGGLVRVSGSVQDVTELKRTQEVLSERERYYQTLMQAMQEDILVIDADHLITEVNDSFVASTGLARDEVLGRHCFEVSHGLDSPCPDHGLACPLRRVFDSGRPASYSHEHRQADGSIRVVDVLMSPLVDESGRVAQVIEAVRDVSEVVRTRAALAETEERFRLLFNKSNDAIFVHYLEDDGLPGRFVEVNDVACERLGFSRDQLLDMSPLDIGVGADPDQARVLGRRLLDQGYARFQTAHRTADGRLIPVESNVRLFELRGHRAVLSVSRDITEQKRAELALRQSEQRYRDLFESISDWICVHDLEGRLQGVNPIVCQATGYTAEELNGRPISDFLLAEFESEFTDLYLAQIKEKGRFEGVFKIRGKGGKLHYIEYSSTLVRTEGREPFVSGVGRDITERRRTERALRRSEERYRLVVDNAHEGICVIQDGTIEFANPKLAELAGRTPEEGVSRPFIDYIHPEDRSEVIDRYQRRLAGEAVPDVHTYRMLRPDGGVRWIDVISVVVAWEGRPGTINFISDTTEQMEAEEALRRSEEQYRLVVDNAHEMILIAQDGVIKFANPKTAEVTGYPLDELISRPFMDFIHPEDRPLVEQLRHRRLAGEDLPGIHPCRTIRRDGEVRWIELNNVSIQWQGCPATLFFVNDVTDQRIAQDEKEKMEVQFQQSQKMEAVGRLAGGIAHDFNNLLTIITGYSDLALAKTSPNDPLHQDLAEIKSAGDRAGALTRQLLIFSRQQVVEPQTVDVKKLMDNVEHMLRRLIGEDIELAVSTDPGVGAVEADPGQLEQVLMNLAINARDAMARGGRLTIETTQVRLDEDYAHDHLEVTPGHYVMVAVSDTGHGMDEDVRSKIFEPFFTTKDTGKGTGLGLSTVYGIVTQSGGHVSVYSEPGHGSTFKVYLPRSDAEVTRLETTEHEDARRRGTETILVVEDEDQVRDLACRVLRRQGYRVLDAANGGEAILVCEQHQGAIHLTLTDVIMPRMSGQDLAKRIQSLRPEMKFLFMSGYTDDAIDRHGVLDREVNFISKPFSSLKLAGKVREILDE